MADSISRSELMQSGLNLIGQALSIFDADLRLAVANHQYQTMFGLPDSLCQPGAFFEDTIRHMMLRGEYGPQDDPDEAVRIRVEQARTFQPHYLERQRPDGSWISVEGAPLSQGGWIAVYTDISDTKRQEALLRARSEELSEQVFDHAEALSAANRELAATITALQETKRVVTETQARTRQVTEMVPADIAHMDRDYRYVFSNRQMPQIFPGTRPDIVGLTGEEALGAPTFAAVRPYLDKALAGRHQVFEITHPESGRRIRIALTPDRGGNGIYILSTDVTAEVEVREALTHASRRELAAKITSGLAHDFGNLLTIILGLQDRLSRSPLPEDASQDVQATLAATRRGVQLLDRIGQIAAPRGMAREPVCLDTLLRDLCAMARPTLGNSVRLSLTTDLPEGRLMLDPGQLQDSLLNLILNARDAMAHDGGEITLDVRATSRWLELEISDTGPGFSPEALSRATEPFFSTKQGQGSGLGLAMVFDQTKIAGGTLHLSNRKDVKGARALLRLPMQPVRPQMVLLAEDDDNLRAMLRRMLISMGHSVIEAGSLAEAQSLTDLPGLTVILSDLQLGDGLGLDLVSPSGPPTLLMTGLPPGDPLRENAPCPVLTKPFDSAMLAEAFVQVTDD
ncbi:hybrid sensor histidine kinase/response regulator [Paracoccus aerodenitrificans]|uniref:hybrid sensor histidine kinase/response regulator n=1 Tax=Paracoccus aerodenitrificans TaxID=3017781 RepID=UPI0022F06882|nr:PAS-domain containing protein [Paracoccus aerodenitrificans]WBU64220.1 PAS-domain containing protein [Paracoccus aerodenitrificans]